MTPQAASKAIAEICALAPVVPVLVIRDPAHARPLAEALIAGGVPVLEVTLRTPAALAAIAEMARVPGGRVGAGTVLTPDDARAARAAGAAFAVSPGATDGLLEACEAEGLPLLPGAATASEAMRLLARGYSVQKFFPAEAAGGVPALKALSGPIPQVRFCPTGGVTPANAPAYLGLGNTICVGGSWIATAEMMTAEDWSGIEARARDAAALGGAPPKTSA